MRRRQYLATICAGLAGVSAGCSNSEEVAVESNNNGSDPETSTQTDTANTFEFGEEKVVVQLGEAELSFAPTGAMLRDALIYSRSNRIYSRTPEDSSAVFLTIDVVLENTGSEVVRPPHSVYFVLDGQQYDLKRYSVDGWKAYTSVNELRPGTSAETSVNFAIPPKEMEGRLIVDFGSYGQSSVAEWPIDLSDLDREAFDWTGFDVGESVTMGAGNTWYSLEVPGYDETPAYTYSGVADSETTHEATEGNKFVLIDLKAENTGESSVFIPDRFDMRLLSESSQFEPERYRDENEQYEGGEIATGVIREGKVLFAVPQSTNSYEFQVDLTDEIFASWTL